MEFYYFTRSAPSTRSTHLAPTYQCRYEYFTDQYGVRYIGTTNTSLTITAPITLAEGHLIVKPELRLDNAKSINGVDYYEDKDGNPISSQQTFGVAFIYKY